MLKINSLTTEFTTIHKTYPQLVIILSFYYSITLHCVYILPKLDTRTIKECIFFDMYIDALIFII